MSVVVIVLSLLCLLLGYALLHMFNHYEGRLFELEKNNIAFIDLQKKYDDLLVVKNSNGHTNDYSEFISESWKPKQTIEFQHSENLGESKFVLKPTEADAEFKKAFDNVADKILKDRAMYCVNVRDCGCKPGKCISPIDISRQQELCDHQWGVEEGEEVCINCEMKKDQ